MKKYIQVRDLKIGEGIPKICVPLCEETKESFLNAAKNLKNIKLDLVEIRIDYLVQVENLKEVKNLLKNIRKILKNTPILFTFRNLKEGGKRSISLEYYKNLNIEVAKTGYVDLIDIEFLIGKNIIRSLIKELHSFNIKVIISNHNINETPPKKEIINILCKMQKIGADLAKIAVTPHSSTDVLILLCATNDMTNKYAKIPIIAVAMKDIGIISRISGEIFGSAITFGKTNISSAPGQIDANKLFDILNVLHNNMGNN